MDIFSGLISNLLLEHDCVIVPGLGGFITKYKPATIHPYHHTFHSPTKQVTFNSALTVNDGLFAKAYAMEAGIDYNAALELIEKNVQSMRISLQKGNKITLEKIGSFRLNKENNIHFTPDSFANYLADSYGLDTFDFHPVNSYDEENTIRIQNPVIRKTLRWAAIVLPIAAVALWTIFNRNAVDTIYKDYASVVPSAIETLITQPSGNATDGKIESSKPAGPTVDRTIAGTTEEKGKVSKETYQVTQKEATALNTSIPETGNKPEPIAVESDTKYHIITGAFQNPDNASRLAEQLRSQGYPASVLGKNHRNLHIVSICSYGSGSEARQAVTELKSKGFSGAWVYKK